VSIEATNRQSNPSKKEYTMKNQSTTKSAPVKASSTQLDIDPATTLIERNSIVRISTLCSMIGISRSMAYERMKPQSRHYDARFPRRIRIGSRSVGWNLLEIIIYIKTLSRI
jgi:prophage regulatory protein